MTVKNIRICDVCGRTVDDKSPPVDEAYESGWITLPYCIMLLPKTANMTRAKSLAGDYCSPFCLINKLEKLIKENKIFERVIK